MIELLAALFSLLSVFRLSKKNIIGWVYGIIGIFFYGVLFYEAKLYSNFTLQFIFLLQCAYGIFKWKKNIDKNKTLIVTRLRLDEWIVYLSTSVLIFFLFKEIFTSSNYIISDSLTTSLSLFACYLTAIAKRESWLFWIAADVIYIWMFISQEFYLSGVLYLVFLIMCVIGYKRWKSNV